MHSIKLMMRLLTIKFYQKWNKEKRIKKKEYPHWNITLSEWIKNQYKALKESPFGDCGGGVAGAVAGGECPLWL